MDPDAPLPDVDAAFGDRIAAARDRLRPLARPFAPWQVTGGTPQPLGSRIGGPVPWPADRDLPRDRTGAPLGLALQVDLSALPADLGLPRTGLLQLFLGPEITRRPITFLRAHRTDDAFPLARGDGWDLALHPDPAALTLHPNAPAPDTDPVIWPDAHAAGYALSFDHAETVLPPPTHWQGAPEIEPFEEALADIDGEALHQHLMQRIWSDQFLGNGVGGFHEPLQLDQRTFFEEYRRYDRCLIRLSDERGLELGDMPYAVLIPSDAWAEGRVDDAILVMDAD